MSHSAASTVNLPHEAGGKRSILVFAFQTDQQANGGLVSLTLVLRNLRAFVPRLVTQRDSALVASWRADGFEVAVEPVPLPASRWRLRDRVSSFTRRIPAMLRGQALVYRLVRRDRIRVVHFNDSDSFAFGALGAKAAGAAVVVALRGTTGIERWRWRAIGELADVVVTLSDDMGRRYRSSLSRGRVPLGPHARIVTIPSIVESPRSDETRESVRRRLGIPGGSFAVGVIGATVPLKRQLDVIREVGRALPRFGEDAALYLVGDYDPAKNDYAARCERERTSLPDPARVKVVGYTDRVTDWYRALDVVVVASDNEGLARAMIEALAHGTPVVSTDVCSAREVLVDADCGRVVPVGDFPALVRELTALAGNPSERERLGRNGSAWVASRFSARAVGAAYDALYLELSERDARTSRTAST